ncbi:MAG: hydrogenase maturation protease [Desulfobulbus sp.]|jgi:coenzyme F420 hydrogenase subunit delta|nr:hydrogenase maturation protease [Desulfobulbus sp.]
MHILHKDISGEDAPAVVVFGCGNSLLGDDGFGPTVIDRLRSYDLPAGMRVVDAGTGLRDHLLDYLLLPVLRPEVLILVDAVHEPGRRPGELTERGPRELPAGKRADLSLHQFPDVNLLDELHREGGVAVLLVTVHTEEAQARLGCGLSPAVAEAVDRTCARVLAAAELHLTAKAPSR